jgi:sugar/nucleoside kinase (ribokinase family)
MQRIDVVAIGNAIVDIICRCDDDALDIIGVAKGKMRSVDNSCFNGALLGKLPKGLELAGGSAANTAVGIASFGGSTAFIGKVAGDTRGYTFQHDIRSVGVAFESAMTTIVGKETSHSLILVTPDGQRTMSTFLGASTELDDSLIDPDLIAGAAFTYLEGYVFDRPTSKAAFTKAVKIASANRRKVALALSDPDCVDRHRRDFIELLQTGVDVLFANERELLALYSGSTLDEAIRRVGRDVPLAVVTRSENGSVIISDGTTLAVPAERVRNVVDATGAGDLYAAGFLFGLTRGLGLAQTGRLASFAASEIISQVGARPEARLGQLARLRGLLP